MAEGNIRKPTQVNILF